MGYLSCSDATPKNFEVSYDGTSANTSAPKLKITTKSQVAALNFKFFWI